MAEHEALRLDRGHRLGQLVVVVVEVAREDDLILARPGPHLATVNVRRLDTQMGDERAPRLALETAGKLEGVECAAHVGLETLVEGIIEGDARRAVDDMSETRA